MFFFDKKIIPDNSKFETPSKQSWRRLKKNKAAMIGLFIILFSVLVAIFAYEIIPDTTPDANEQVTQVSLQNPGFNIQMLQVHRDKEASNTSFFVQLFSGTESEEELIPITNYKVVGDKILIDEYRGKGLKPKQQWYYLADVVYANSVTDTSEILSGENVSFKNFQEETITKNITDLKNEVEKNHVTKKRFLLGTDFLGRDIMSRLLLGVRVSLSVGIISVLISLLIGVSLGAAAGYYRGKTDSIIMFLINIIWSIPTILFVFALSLALGKGFWQIFIAVGLTMWVSVARLVRGQVMSIRETEFVEAAKSLGYKSPRIIFRHILPNILGPVMVIAAANFASAILIEAGLSFIGIGVQPPTPSWGSMIKENYSFIITSNPVIALAPGIAIMILVLSFNLLGNGLRDALDVKTK